MFDAYTPKVSKENIEEFGKLIDYHNQKIIEAKCRKYSIIEDDETDSTSNQLNNDSCKSNKFSTLLKGGSDLSAVQSELKLNEEEYEKCYQSPQRLSNHFNTIYNSATSWSFEKKPKLENPFRSRIAKTKLNFNFVPNTESNLSSGNKSENKPCLKHSSLLDVSTKTDLSESTELNQFLFNSKRKNTFN